MFLLYFDYDSGTYYIYIDHPHEQIKWLINHLSLRGTNNVVANEEIQHQSGGLIKDS